MLWLKHILKKIFLEDWMMKLIALTITLALWLGVTGLSKPTTQRLTAIPFKLLFSSNIEVTSPLITEVNLVVSGDSRRLAQINERALSVSIEIPDAPTGDRVISLTSETVAVSGLETGVKIDEIQPNRITVRIEAVEEKEVPVKAETTGELPEGYEVYSETITPPRIRVRGPANFIRSLSFVSTGPIDLTNRLTDFTEKQISVSVANPKATVADTVVDVAFRIGEKRVERVYSIADEGGRRATVVLFGGKSLFEDLRNENLHIEMTKNDAGEDVPRVILPPGLEGKVEVRSVKLRGR
jgi:YbbR domain-containing protein